MGIKTRRGGARERKGWSHRGSGGAKDKKGRNQREQRVGLKEGEELDRGRGGVKKKGKSQREEGMELKRGKRWA